MRKITLFLLIVCFAISIKAQNHISNAFFEARAGFHTEINDNNKYNNHFTGDFFNFQMFGNITDNISYRVRQRLNKNPFAEDNIFNATDFLYFDWKIDNKWSLMVGKQEIFIGGFEYDYAPIDVYYWSGFCNEIPQSYGIGAALGYSFNKDNILYLQIINSPFSLGNKDNLLSYNLAWFGKVADWWKTIWSTNYVEGEKDEKLFYVALGNRFEINDFYLEADFTQTINNNEDDLKYTYAFVGKLNYNYRDKLDAFIKGGYDKEPISYSSVCYTPFNYTDNYVFFGGGVEYFPLKNKDLRLHCVYYYNDKDKKHNIDFGVTWKLNVVKK